MSDAPTQLDYDPDTLNVVTTQDAIDELRENDEQLARDFLIYGENYTTTDGIRVPPEDWPNPQPVNAPPADSGALDWTGSLDTAPSTRESIIDDIQAATLSLSSNGRVEALARYACVVDGEIGWLRDDAPIQKRDEQPSTLCLVCKRERCGIHEAEQRRIVIARTRQTGGALVPEEYADELLEMLHSSRSFTVRDLRPQTQRARGRRRGKCRPHKATNCNVRGCA